MLHTAFLRVKEQSRILLVRSPSTSHSNFQVQIQFCNHEIIENVRIIRNNMLKVQNLVGLPAEYLGSPQKDNLPDTFKPDRK